MITKVENGTAKIWWSYFYAVKRGINLVFHSFFCNFVRILSYSLYKGSLGN